MFVRIAIILALASVPLAARGQGVLRDDFEGPEPVLRPAGGDGRHRVDVHERVETGPHSGRRCEHLQITGGGSTAIYYSYPIRPARVIGELALGLWVRADRPGPQLVARVVLPRSPHPTTGQPLTTLLRGTDYRQVGNWQLLRVDNLPRALELQVRVLRSQFGPQVDAREAYVDMVLVNVYGGAGTTNVWFDDLEITGAIEPAAVAAGDSQQPTLAVPGSRARTPARRRDARDRIQEPTAGGRRAVLSPGHRTSRRTARAIASLGLQLRAPGRPGLGRAVGRCGAAATVVDCSAPAARSARRPAMRPPAASTRGPNVSSEYDPVLAWDLGSQLTSRELDVARAWADAVQKADTRSRPIVCGPTSDLQNYTPPAVQGLSRRT